MNRLTALLPSWLLCITFLAAQEQPPAATAATETPREPLRVLLVGHDPAAPKIMFSDMAVARTEQLYRERTAAWEALLRYHFRDVKVVYGSDYRVEMSDAVDVTIFDAQPKAITAAKRGKDPVTGESTYQAATYLPESFDRPAILIAANAPTIGEPLGLKLDWL